MIKTSERDDLRPKAVAFFLAAIFVGDVWLWKLTLPISMLVLPVLIVLYPPWDVLRLRLLRLPGGAFALGVLLLVAAVQIAWGLSPDPRGDLAIWMPIAFAGASILTLHRAAVADRWIRKGILGGALLTGIVMIGMAMVAPTGFFLVPGQNAEQMEADYRAEQATERERTTAALREQVRSRSLDPEALRAALERLREAEAIAARPLQGREVFGEGMSEGTADFYDVKNRMRNLLGLSNYVAVFLVFATVVALFCRRWWVTLALGLLAAATLSRFGFGFLGLAAAGYGLRRRGLSLSTIAALTAIAVVGGLGALFYLQGAMPWLPGLESLVTRFRYWGSALAIIGERPWIGAARSFVLEDRFLTPAWNAHNSILTLAVHFGAAGLIAYALYVGLALRTMAKAARSSQLWAGIFLATVLLLLWGLVENIVLTPAFEILFGGLYALAWSRNRLAIPDEEPGGAGQGVAPRE